MTTTDPKNRISHDLPAEDDQAIDGHVGGLEELFGKYGVDLGTEDTRRFALVGAGRSVYVKAALAIAQANAQLCPPWVIPLEFTRDVDGADYFDAMERRLNAVLSLVRGAGILCRKEAYEAANAVYDFCKKGAEFNVPGAKDAADELGQNFEKLGSGTGKSDPPSGTGSAG